MHCPGHRSPPSVMRGGFVCRVAEVADYHLIPSVLAWFGVIHETGLTGSVFVVLGESKFEKFNISIE